MVFVRTVNLDRPDSDGDELVSELRKEDKDIELVKHQWGAFHGTALDLYLRRSEVRTVILCGLMTNFGVETTARAADELGYSVVCVEDGMASFSPSAHAFACNEIFPRLGHVCSTDVVVRELAGASQPKRASAI